MNNRNLTENTQYKMLRPKNHRFFLHVSHFIARAKTRFLCYIYANAHISWYNLFDSSCIMILLICFLSLGLFLSLITIYCSYFLHINSRLVQFIVKEKCHHLHDLCYFSASFRQLQIQFERVHFQWFSVDFLKLLFNRQNTRSAKKKREKSKVKDHHTFTMNWLQLSESSSEYLGNGIKFPYFLICDICWIFIWTWFMLTFVSCLSVFFFLLSVCLSVRWFICPLIDSVTLHFTVR